MKMAFIDKNDWHRLWAGIGAKIDRAKIRAWSFYDEAGTGKRLTIVALAVFLFFDLLTVFWGMPNAFSWSVDDPSGIFTVGFVKSDGSNYAPFGYIARLILYLPFLAAYYVFGAWKLGSVKYPSFGFADPDWQLGFLMILTRAVHFSLFLATGYFIYRLASRFNRRAAWWAVLFYMLSPLAVEFSTYGNVDTPVMFFAAWALYHLSEILFSGPEDGRGRVRNWMLFFAAFAGVVGLKESVAMAFIIPFFFVFIKCGYLSKSGWKRVWPEFFPGLWTFGLLFIIGNNIIFDWPKYWNHAVRLVSRDSATNAVFAVLSPWELFKRTAESLALIAPAPLLFFLAGWKNMLKKKYRLYSWFLLSFAASSFVFFICLFGRTYLRHNLPIMMIVSIFAGLAAWQIFARSKGKLRFFLRLGLVCFLFSLAAIPVWGKFNDSRYEAEKFISSMVKDKDVQVLSNRYHVYLPRMHRLAASEDWRAKSISFNTKISREPDKDLYIVQYDKFVFYREAFSAGYGIIYDSGPRQPYYHAWDVRLSPCRISCRVLVLEKKSLGGVDSIKIEEDIKSYYDEELKKPDIYYEDGEEQKDSPSN